MSEEYIKVFTESQILVHRLQDLLNEKEIHSRVRNDGESARLAGFGVPSNSFLPERACNASTTLSVHARSEFNFENAVTAPSSNSAVLVLE